eukprot:TRINITY_DN8719_c0_g1_i1.p1 TRINITY_DN8719_c0_g1~~TRINITY_DN8719_c0_g1_i1.p1  ORF type:complete len:472 (-),score=108.81 TRINITY_DN8719_c0_g1_i1:97-1512(-)
MPLGPRRRLQAAIQRRLKNAKTLTSKDEIFATPQNDGDSDSDISSDANEDASTDNPTKLEDNYGIQEYAMVPTFEIDGSGAEKSNPKTKVNYGKIGKNDIPSTFESSTDRKSRMAKERRATIQKLQDTGESGWICIECNTVNAEFLNTCNKCDTTRPVGPDIEYYSDEEVGVFAQTSEPAATTTPVLKESAPLSYVAKPLDLPDISSSDDDDDDEDGLGPDEWLCTKCKEVNPVFANTCGKCDTTRVDDSATAFPADTPTVQILKKTDTQAPAKELTAEEKLENIKFKLQMFGVGGEQEKFTVAEKLRELDSGQLMKLMKGAKTDSPEFTECLRAYALQPKEEAKPEHCAQLLQYLHVPSANTRVWVVCALTKCGNPACVGPLLEYLRSGQENDRFVIESMCSAFASYRAFEAVPDLVQLWRNHVISNIRAAAEVSLKVLGGPEVAQAFNSSAILREQMELLLNGMTNKSN